MSLNSASSRLYQRIVLSSSEFFVWNRRNSFSVFIQAIENQKGGGKKQFPTLSDRCLIIYHVVSAGMEDNTGYNKYIQGSLATFGTAISRAFHMAM